MANSTYSIKNGIGTLNLPNSDAAITIGVTTAGLGQITFSKSDNVSENNVSADGAVMTSAIAAPNGTVALEIQQTSSIHTSLLAWYAYLESAFNSGDVSDWTAASLYWVNSLDGTSHTATGISPQKNPDKVYTKQGQMITWTLMAQSIVNE